MYITSSLQPRWLVTMAAAEHGWALHGLPAWRSWALSLAFLGEASGSNMEILSMAGWLLQQSDGDLDTSTWTMIHDTFGCLMLFAEVSHGNWGSSVVNKVWGLDCEVRSHHHFGCLTCWQITSLSDFRLPSQHASFGCSCNLLTWLETLWWSEYSGMVQYGPTALGIHEVHLVLSWLEIYYIYIYKWAISKTLGSRKGHPQIWEGPIAYHTFVQ